MTQTPAARHPAPVRREAKPKILVALAAVLVLMVGCSAEGDSAGDEAPDDKAAGTAAPAATPTSESTSAAVAPAEVPTIEVTAPASSVMPQVTGMTQADAEAALAAAGLGVSEVRELPSAQPAGTVLRQSRKVGASLLAGTPVVLIVAGPYPSVPSVVGLAKAAAVTELEAVGFVVTVTTETRTSGKNGVVLRQSPAGSELAKPGSTIAVVVSSVVRAVAPPVAQSCTPGYTPCLPPASDYDCASGSGDGPEYADGPIHVTGSDPYDLDSEGDGTACES